MLKGGTIVDATITNAPSSTKNAQKARDPEMKQTKKGNEWRFGMKCHAGVDAFSGLVHTITVTAANVHDITQAARLIREGDEFLYGDSAYLGIQKRSEVADDPHLSSIDYRAARESLFFIVKYHPLKRYSSGMQLSAACFIFARLSLISEPL